MEKMGRMGKVPAGAVAVVEAAEGVVGVAEGVVGAAVWAVGEVREVGEATVRIEVTDRGSKMSHIYMIMPALGKSGLAFPCSRASLTDSPF